MKKKLPFKTASVICCAVLVVSFVLAAIPAFKNDPGHSAEIPQNTYVPPLHEREWDYCSEETEYACAMYIDGALAGYYADIEAAKAALNAAADKQLSVLCAECINSELKNDVTFKSGYYPVSQLAESTAGIPILTLQYTVYNTVSRVIDYAVEYRDNAEQYSGKEKVLTSGAEGLSDDTYVVVMLNGAEISRTLVSSNIIAEPVNEVIERGIKLKKGSADITPLFTMPYEGGITSEYGTRYLMGNTFHKGVDISGVNNSSECYGAEIHAAGDGVVIRAGWESGFGYLVIIEHANGMRTYYAHQKKVGVKEGAYVKQGDVIGYIGSTGNSTGPHVHFEIRVPDENGKYYAIDPEPYIINYSSYPHR